MARNKQTAAEKAAILEFDTREQAAKMNAKRHLDEIKDMSAQIVGKTARLCLDLVALNSVIMERTNGDVSLFDTIYSDTSHRFVAAVSGDDITRWAQHVTRKIGRYWTVKEKKEHLGVDHLTSSDDDILDQSQQRAMKECYYPFHALASGTLKLSPTEVIKKDDDGNDVIGDDGKPVLEEITITPRGELIVQDHPVHSPLAKAGKEFSNGSNANTLNFSQFKAATRALIGPADDGERKSSMTAFCEKLMAKIKDRDANKFTPADVTALENLMMAIENKLLLIEQHREDIANATDEGDDDSDDDFSAEELADGEDLNEEMLAIARTAAA